MGSNPRVISDFVRQIFPKACKYFFAFCEMVNVEVKES